MGIKVKARQTKLAVGPSKGEYRFIMQAEIYSTLKQEKVVSEASIRSGIPKGTLNASWQAIGEVIKAWATEGHSVAVPGLGTMRFGLQAAAVAKVEDVSSGLITTRKVIFTPSTTIKQELKGASINITCYDKEGNVIKQVNSSDPGDVDDEGGSDNPGGGGLDENPLG
ncbi:HU family DNA-binding protein [Bacteroides timonensis]|uniref:HU family DNA-binding protein n=1 Tax=Bacteroides timonensis TaxID=1470345 RepID=UPI0004AF273A|nr:DNA-binding protein [Bacteroides timonensis]